MTADETTAEILPNDTVLIVGAGPVGLVLATALAHDGVKSILLERNLDTTKWPKMDLTNARSMEHFRRLGLAEHLRKEGVASHFALDVLLSAGLNDKEPITKWSLPSVDEYWKQIHTQNDGTLPREPWQRISQAIFERWIRKQCDANPLIDVRFGWKVDSLTEFNDNATVVATDVTTNDRHTITASYIIGCDGGSSRVRRDLSISLDGDSVPGYAVLVHFKSRDLTRLHAQGQFWHIFFPSPRGMTGAIIAQDEIDTWTVHMLLPLHIDATPIPSEDVVATVLGGMGPPYPVQIDKVLVRSTWRPTIAIARHYSTRKGRVYLAGDAAHQNTPTGGYGMNVGLADAFDLAWKLSGTINGWGGPQLLKSYEAERRPVAQLSVQRAGEHWAVHMAEEQHAAGLFIDSAVVLDPANSPAKQNMRQQIHEYYQSNDSENQDRGVEMDYRYKSPINVPDGTDEPPWSHRHYHPSTFPGTRAPHVFLKDGSALFDHFHPTGFTLVLLVNSSQSDAQWGMFTMEARMRGLPFKVLNLHTEEKVQEIWTGVNGPGIVLVRPDGHVCWRGTEFERGTAKKVVRVVSGLGGDDEGNGPAVDLGGVVGEEGSAKGHWGMEEERPGEEKEKAGQK